MTVYFFQLLFLGLAGLLFHKKGRSNKRMMGLSLFFLLFTLMAFRDISVGVDTNSYSYIFKDICRQDYSHLLHNETYRYEMIFALFMKVISEISDSYFFYQFVFSILYCWLAVRYLSNCSKDLFFCGILYLSCGLYLGTFNIQRQMLAVVILMNGWNYLADRKWVKAMLLTCIGIMIHLTSVVFLFVIISFFVCQKYSWVVKILPAVMLSLSLSYKIILGHFSDYLFMYNNYLDNHKDVQEAGGIYAIWSIVVLLSVYLIYISGNKTDFKTKLAGVFSLQYVFANLVGLEFNYIERLGAFFLPFSIIVYEQIFYCIKNQNIATIYKYVVGICYIFYYYLSFQSEQYQYRSFLF